jgi:hypothetical protein
LMGAVAAIVAGFVAFGPLKLFGGAPMPSEARVAQAFSVPSGYQLQAAPPEVMSQMQTMVETDEELKGHIGAFDVQTINQGALVVGAIVVVAVDPDEVDDEGREEFAGGASIPLGITMSQEQIGSSEAWIGSTPEASAALIYDDVGLLILVAAQGPERARQIITHIEQANSLIVD